MNRILEIAAMALGGLSLFAVCFLGFATMAGVPLHSVAVIGNLFPEPAAKPDYVATTGGELEPAPRRPDPAAVYQSSLGVLGTWSLESPFSADELKSLVDEVKLKKEQLNVELKNVARRAGELDAREEALAEQYGALDELRARLEAFETELLMRSAEVERDEGAKAAQDDRTYKKLASLISGIQDPKEAGLRLTAYSPEEATKILLHLTPEKKALEILNTFSGDRYLAYSRAWAEAAGAPRK
jgi:flagellar motility protein MotE (MotC chaperone)